jgi:hypothetical protein
MYKSNYVPASREPMVYIASHTWADRFKSGSRRATIEVYSNCDSVRLYNDATDSESFGVKKNGGIGSHFVWENRLVKYNVLRAVGYCQGKAVTEDVIVLGGLESAPHFEALYSPSAIVPTPADNNVDLIKGAEGYSYLYRINCGGDSYTDSYGQLWSQDNSRYSHSWSEEFIAEGDTLLSPYQASQRTTFDPIHGTRDWTLFQSFRFGRHKLSYEFPLADGDYRVELYFAEPWHGTGGSEKTDAEGLRLFDVAVNGETVINDLDLWAEAGHDGALRRVVNATVRGGKMTISFPEVKAGQAIISAIAIARKGEGEPMAKADTDFSWAAQEEVVMEKTPKELLPEDKNAREQVSYKAKSVKKNSITWEISTGLAQVYALRFRYMNTTGKPIHAHMQLIDSKDGVLKDDEITFAETPKKWRMVSTTTGGYINAGKYRIVITADDMNGLSFETLGVQ